MPGGYFTFRLFFEAISYNIKYPRIFISMYIAGFNVSSYIAEKKIK